MQRLSGITPISFKGVTATTGLFCVLILYGLAVLIASFQNWLLPLKEVNGAFYTQYNNYVIFKRSFFHLLENQNLYAWYLTEQWDLFKYSPSFALVFGSLAFLPDIVGLIIWNGANAFLIVAGVLSLPNLKLSTKNKILLFVLIELLTSMQNSQSNGLMVGLILLGFACLESRKPFFGILAIMSTVFIKIFGIVVLPLIMFYPNKAKLALYTVISFLILLLLPLLLVAPSELIKQYENWWILLAADHSDSLGLSVMGWLASWFEVDWSKTAIVLVGSLPLLAQFALVHRYKAFCFRLSVVANILIWMVIFNHKAESPTFIIATIGAAVWYFAESRHKLNGMLMVFVFIFTILSPTDVFPNYIQDNFFDPYVVKVVPCIIVWATIVFHSVLFVDARKTKRQLN